MMLKSPARALDDVADAFATANELARILGKIARGRVDNGRPLTGETARQLARNALDAAGMGWNGLGEA